MSEQNGIQDISIKDTTLPITQDYYPQPVALDTEFSYTITVNNLFGGDIANVVVTNAINSGFQFKSASATNSTDQPQYNSGTLTCNVGYLSNEANCAITVVVKAIKEGNITNRVEVEGKRVIPEFPPISFDSDFTIRVVNVPGDIDTILAVVGTETGASIKGISDSVGSISNNVNTMSGAIGIPVSGETILGDINSIIGVIGAAEAGHTVSGDIKTILGVIGTETGAMDNLTTIEEDTNDRVKTIERGITHIVNPGVYNLTTGVVVKDYNAASIIAAIDRKIGSTSILQVIVKLIDHSQSQPQVIYSKTVDITKHNNIFVLGAPPTEYEVLFEGIEEGVYVWTAARTNGVFDSVSVNNLISSNTFKHSDLIMIDSQA